jgi:hypothetical protein
LRCDPEFGKSNINYSISKSPKYKETSLTKESAACPRASCKLPKWYVRVHSNMSKIDVCRASQLDGDAASGISLPTVSKMESGSYGEPGFRTMVRLARGYGVPLVNFERFFK